MVQHCTILSPSFLHKKGHRKFALHGTGGGALGIGKNRSRQIGKQPTCIFLGSSDVIPVIVIHTKEFLFGTGHILLLSVRFCGITVLCGGEKPLKTLAAGGGK
jgi:hypothetical protein